MCTQNTSTNWYHMYRFIHFDMYIKLQNYICIQMICLYIQYITICPFGSIQYTSSSETSAFHGCHAENLGEALETTNWTSTGVDLLYGLYIRANISRLIIWSPRTDSFRDFSNGEPTSHWLVSVTGWFSQFFGMSISHQTTGKDTWILLFYLLCSYGPTNSFKWDYDLQLLLKRVYNVMCYIYIYHTSL